MTDGRRLKPKQLRFVEQYMLDLNATQAAIRAGYSKHSAMELGYQLLQNPSVQAAIQAEQKRLAVAEGIRREKVIAEAARVAFSDVRRLFDEERRLKDPQTWDDATAAAVSSIECVSVGTAEAPVFVKRVKFWNKLDALEKLIKHLGLDKAEQQDGPQGVEIRLIGIPAKDPVPD